MQTNTTSTTLSGNPDIEETSSFETQIQALQELMVLLVLRFCIGEWFQA